MRIILPHSKVVSQHNDLSKSKLDDVLRETIEQSRSAPYGLEMFDGVSQRFLFFRDGQIYAAGLVENDQFSDTPIRDFMLAAGTMSFPQIVSYELTGKILHSLLILFQKKPALRVQTNLVDLDEVLDKIEAEGKSCVVSAAQGTFVALLRYEKGVVTALSHGESHPTPRESSFRDEFLVKIYTISAEQSLTISIYEDLLVTYAADAKTIAPGFTGRLDELFLSKPPMVSLRFKGKEIDHWVIDKPVMRIGRTPDNDIVIDNLGVSRLHAVIEEEKGSYYIKDCDSLNGTVLGANKIGRARLDDGAEIHIGKHVILFKRQGGRDLPAEQTVEGFDQTMIINRDAPPPAPAAPSESVPEAQRKPRLIVKTEWGDRIIELKDGQLSIGRDLEADLPIEGWFVARRHAEIIRDGNHYKIRQLGGLRRIRIDGERVREAELKEGHTIQIANEEFVFEE